MKAKAALSAVLAVCLTWASAAGGGEAGPLLRSQQRFEQTPFCVSLGGCALYRVTWGNEGKIVYKTGRYHVRHLPGVRVEVTRDDSNNEVVTVMAYFQSRRDGPDVRRALVRLTESATGAALAPGKLEKCLALNGKVGDRGDIPHQVGSRTYTAACLRTEENEIIYMLYVE